jgi:SdrD B-like protein
MKDGKRVILTGTLPLALKFTKTDSNGYYHFKNLKAGTYKVRIKLCNKS